MDSPFLIGTSGWRYAHWRGPFYPETLPETRWFAFYASVFSTVEINATFYRTFRESTYLKWRDQAPEGFVYVLKVPRLITHRRYLVEVDEPIRAFWRSVQLLEDHLGVVLLQLPPGLAYDPARLETALRAFPDPARVAVEFRHDRWHTEEVRTLLTHLGTAFCAVDSPRMRPLDWLTGRVGYVRLHGRRHWYADRYTDEELEAIAALARGLIDRGAEQVYVFFNNDFHAHAVANARMLQSLLAPNRA